MMYTVLWILSLSMIGCNALTLQDMFPFGSNYQDTVGNNAERTINVTGLFSQASLLDSYFPSPIPARFSNFRIFGVDLGKNAYVNFNGHITFGAPYNDFNPYTINITTNTVSAIFAPYFSDNDLRRANGLLYVRTSSNPSDISLANQLIQGRGFTTFSTQYCIIATWENLKYYVSDENQRGNAAFQQENTYQVALCTDGVTGHVIYHYLKLEWAKSQDLTTNFATTGWQVKQATIPDLVSWVAPSSGTDFSRTTLVTSTNVNLAGRWMRSQAILGECSGKANGIYAKDCSTYIFCCNQLVDNTRTCPVGTYYHPFSQSCVDVRNYNCGGINFCDGRADGRYSNGATARLDDFYECTSQTTRLLYCSHAFTFGSTSRCN